MKSIAKSPQLIIKLDKASSTYKSGQIISGYVDLSLLEQARRKQIKNAKLIVNGVLSAKKLKKVSQQKCKSHSLFYHQGQLQGNKNQILLFKFKLQKSRDCPLLETFYGVNIQVAYTISVSMMTNAVPIQVSTNFYVQVLGQGTAIINQLKVNRRLRDFKLTDQDVAGQKVPKFKFICQIQSDILNFTQDFCGTFNILYSQTKIKDISLELCRVEQINIPMSQLRQRSQIQVIQFCDGDVPRSLQIPFNMILPRYFCCPDFQYRQFKLGFQVSIQVTFVSGVRASFPVPIFIYR